MPDWDYVSSPPVKLHVSKPPNERPWGLWNLSHSSHKNQRRRGPRYLRLGDTSTHTPLSGSVTSTSAGYSPQAQTEPQQRQGAGITSKRPVLSFPGHQGGNPNFPPCGKRSSRLGASFLSQAHPTHSRRHIHAHAWPLRILSPIGYAWLPLAIVPNLPRVSPMGAPPLLPSGQKVPLCPLVSAPHETLCYMTMKMRRRRREDSCARHFRVINSHNSNLCHTEHD